MALFRRESSQRLTGKKLGVVWLFFEPVVQITFFALIFHFSGRQGPHSMDVIAFMIYGIIPFFMFSKTLGKTAGGIGAYRNLLSFPVMKPIDAIIARALFEFMVYVLILSVLTLIGYYFRFIDGIARFEYIMLAILTASMMGASSGLLLAAAGSRYSVLEKFTPIINRAMFLTSGIFFSYSMLPQFAKSILWWNPMLHVTEMSRHGLEVNFPSSGFMVIYPLTVTLLLFFCGIVALFLAERDPNSKIRGVA